MKATVKDGAQGNQSALERIRSTFDTRVEELRQSLDARVKANPLSHMHHLLWWIAVRLLIDPVI